MTVCDLKEMQEPYSEFVGIHLYAGNWYGFLYYGGKNRWSRYPINRSGDRANATVTHADGTKN